MEYTLEEKYNSIKKAVLKCDSKNPVEIARSVMNEEFVSMHGPEHHFLDGASFLMAYFNAGGQIDPDICLDELAKRTIKMPGAMCGYWGVCGSVAAVGAALSVIHGTSPLSTDEYYADNMKLTSSIIAKMAEIGGARCCKRNAFLSLSTGAEFVKEHYNIPMETGEIVCDYYPRNAQCLGNKCPYHPNKAIYELKKIYREWLLQLKDKNNDFLISQHYSNPYYAGIQGNWFSAKNKVLIVGQEGYFYNNSGNGKLQSQGKNGIYAAVNYDDINTLMAWAKDCLEKQLKEEEYKSHYEYSVISSPFWTWIRMIYSDYIAFAWTELDKICKEKYTEKGSCCLSTKEKCALHSTDIKILQKEIEILQPTHVIFLGWHYRSLQRELPKIFNELYSKENIWKDKKLITMKFDNKTFIFSYHPNKLKKEYRDAFVAAFKNSLNN